MAHAGRPLVVTQGDPEGVGPELLCRVAAAGAFRPGDQVVVGPEVLDRVCEAIDEPWAREGRSVLRQLRVPEGGERPGQFAALALGLEVLARTPGAALVTAPIDKARAQAEGLPTPGHTEYLAQRAGVRDFAMAMIGPRLRVVLATIHLPVSAVPAALDRAAVTRAARLLARWLMEDGRLARPRVGVLGLNPHAGEGGLLGTEEIDVIAPAIAALRQEFGEAVAFSGPLAADTAFANHAAGRLDGLVAMYHDQGLAPFKLMHFHDGVNLTLGLPYVRTSPDHGTARDIAFQGIASPASLAAAIELARGRR